MKQFLSRVARFFWSWAFLKFILWTLTIIILLYVEEDWRGARTWEATKAKWEAKGESLDYFGKCIPAPIPESVNLAAIPLFKMVPDPKRGNDPYPVALDQAMRLGRGYNGSNRPVLAHWQLGEVNDRKKIESDVAAEYSAAFQGTNPPQKALDQFAALFPCLQDLRAAAATRPGFLLSLDYSVNPPDSRALGPVTSTLRLSRVLTLEAILALNDSQADVALDNLKVNFQVAAGIAKDPTLVAGLVAMGMVAIGNGAIFDGLAHHQWSDADLVKLDQFLRSINFLSNGQYGLRSEAASAVADIEYYRHSKVPIYGLFMGMDQESRPGLVPSLMVRYAPPWASGWWDQSKSQVSDSILRAVPALDPQNHRAYPALSQELQRRIEQAKLSPLAYAPWNIWATTAVGPIDGCVQKFAAAQVWIDELRIACALERYRLAHDVYPESLDALVPNYLDELPRDLVNGEPYHYRLQPNGTFLLYSIGWNLTDDGGKVSYKSDNDVHQKTIDYDHGDWAWPTPR